MFERSDIDSRVIALQRQSGFTLLELLVVIVIIVTAAAVALDYKTILVADHEITNF